jgi:hypothetical protein
MTDFASTGSTSHTQDLSLSEGNYVYYFKCRDIVGNEANTNVSFAVQLPSGGNPGSSGSRSSGVTIVWVEENKTTANTTEEASTETNKETPISEPTNAPIAPNENVQPAVNGPTGFMIANPAATGVGIVMVIVGLWLFLRKFSNSLRPKF